MLRPWTFLALAALAAWAVPAGAQAPPAPPDEERAAQDSSAEAVGPVLLGSWHLRHRDPVTFLAFGRDGLVSGGMEGDVHLWDPADGALLESAPRGGSSATDGALLADGALLVAHGDGTLVRWRPGAEPAPVVSEVGTLVAARADGTRAYLGGRDGAVRLVDVARGAVAHEVQLGEFMAGRGAFVPRTDLLVVLGINRNRLLRRGGTQDQDVSALVVLDATTGAEVRRIPSTSRALRDLAVRVVAGDADDAELLAIDDQGGLLAWRLADGVLRGAWDPEQAAPATCLALGPDDTAAIGREDGHVILLGLDDGVERGRARVGSRPISALAIAPDGATLAASSGTEIFLFGLPGLAPRASVFRHAGPISALDWSPDGTRLATGSLDRGARTWRAADGVGELALEGNPGFVYGVALGELGAAAGGQDGHVRLFEPDGKLRVDVAAHTSACTAVALSPDGATLATAGADGVVQLLDPRTGERRHAVTGIPGLELRLAWFADGKRVAVGAADVRVIDVASGAVVQTLPRPHAPITSLAVAPDGATIAAGLADKTIALYDLAGEPLRFLHGHPGRVQAVAFALGSDGNARLASASTNETCVRLWDFAERRHVATLDGFAREVLALAFSPDGARLAAGSMDGTARIWSLGG